MWLQYGGYRHAENEASFTISINEIANESGQPYDSQHTWNITGQLQADTTAELLVKMRQLEAAYSRWGYDLGFFDDAGNLCHALLSAGSTTGVQINNLSYPRGEGAQLSTFRDYQITASARYPVAATNPLRSFNETLSFRGGGPERVVIECANGDPQEQIVKAKTTVFANQSGSAVGRFGYPSVPPPIFPGKERITGNQPGNPVWGSPKFVNGVYLDWPVSWNYEFISATPLIGVPNRWPAG